MQWVTRDEQPELTGVDGPDVWPEYNVHADVVGELWPRLHTEVPQFQSICQDEDSGAVLAEANTVPCWWDGTDDGLGSGIDEKMTAAFARLERGQPANALCALAAKVSPAARSRGLAAETLRQMLRVATAHGLSAVIARVRPSWKASCPTFPIAQYEPSRVSRRLLSLTGWSHDTTGTTTAW